MDTQQDETAPARRTARLQPEERKRLLVERAADFFSEEGFDAGTRVLAQQMQVTQPLIYRYFQSKDDLINEVYRKVYVGQWQDCWTDTICDRSRPLRERLEAFYRSYRQAVFNRRWMRIFFFAALKGLDLNSRYIRRVTDRLLVPICREMRAELGHDPEGTITDLELELVWLMHGMIFYQGIREQIYRLGGVNYELAIATAIETYLGAAPRIVAQAIAADGKR